jgi:hypothetical protein
MGKYLKQTKVVAKEIECFHKYAGAKGYVQSWYYYQKLSDILNQVDIIAFKVSAVISLPSQD